MRGRRNRWIAWSCALLFGWATALSASAEPVRVAVAALVNSAPLVVAEDLGFFRDAGLEVELELYSSGRDALYAVLEGKADVATVAESPFVNSIFRGQSPCVLAVLNLSNRFVLIVGRGDRGIDSILKLRGRTVGVTADTNAEFFLDSILLLHGMTSDDVQLVYGPPSVLTRKIMEGELDAITVWNPHAAAAIDHLGRDAFVYTNDWIYNMNLLLTSTRGYIEQHYQQTVSFLRALERANEAIRREPIRTRRIVAQALGIRPESALWESHDFVLSLNQALPENLESQAQWVVRRRGRSETIPDFTRYLCPGPLSEANPGAVTIIE